MEIPDILINIFSKGKNVLDMATKKSPYYLSQICFGQLLEQQNLVKRSIDVPKFAKWLSCCLDTKPSKSIELEPTFVILEYAFQSITVTEIILKHNYSLVKELIRMTKVSKLDSDVLYANMRVNFFFLF